MAWTGIMLVAGSFIGSGVGGSVLRLPGVTMGPAVVGTAMAGLLVVCAPLVAGEGPRVGSKVGRGLGLSVNPIGGLGETGIFVGVSDWSA